MVAIIKSSSSVRNVLRYNENKLKENAAQLIHSMNFAKDTDKLSYNDKLRTIEKLTSLNQRTRLNTVHISLNFDVGEKIKSTTLQQIAETYMQKIGFAHQPCLVYEHYDAAHPHLHIVTTNIQPDGSRIKMQNIGRNQSEKARKEIERDFKLKPAQTNSLTDAWELKPLNAVKLEYGKVATKRSITTILNAVLPVYKYSSLPELNAILRQYNIMADRGGEDSRVFKNKGLIYRVLDQQGKKIAPPIKASLIYNKPGLEFLKGRFLENAVLKQAYKQRVKNEIDSFFTSNKAKSLEQLTSNLDQSNIQTVLRRNDEGIIYGITYIDTQTKCVFNGSELGKQYSANQIQARCNSEIFPSPEIVPVKQTSSREEPTLQPLFEKAEKPSIAPESKTSFLPDLINTLTKSEYEGFLPAELRKKQKQKRKRRKL